MPLSLPKSLLCLSLGAIFSLQSTTFAAGPTVLAPGASIAVGDSVSDIDLSGNILYAVDNGSGTDRSIGGVTFLGSQRGGGIAGYTQSVSNPALAWGTYDVGASA